MARASAAFALQAGGELPVVVAFPPALQRVRVVRDAAARRAEIGVRHRAALTVRDGVDQIALLGQQLGDIEPRLGMVGIESHRLAKLGERRAVGVACGAHALHDGYTDLVYVMLPIWQAEFGLGFAALGLMKTVFSGTSEKSIPPSLHTGPSDQLNPTASTSICVLGAINASRAGSRRSIEPLNSGTCSAANAASEPNRNKKNR